MIAIRSRRTGDLRTSSGSASMSHRHQRRSSWIMSWAPTRRRRYLAASGSTRMISVRSCLLTRITFGFRSPDALVAIAMLDLGGKCPALPSGLTPEPAHGCVTRAPFSPPNGGSWPTLAAVASTHGVGHVFRQGRLKSSASPTWGPELRLATLYR